jgi:predicted 3-demethylubiquinone-9 3-methyltransferase (glyoxalase superfamily)
MQKITPFLWFDHQAEEPANFYVSVFKNSHIDRITRFGKGLPGPEGAVMTVAFQIEGQGFVALNGGPHFTFSPAISFYVDCRTQAEVDELWAKLVEGGAEEQCGWLRDKYGVSWQIIPAGLVEMLSSEDADKSHRATQAMLQMHKIDLEKIRRAYEGG